MLLVLPQRERTAQRLSCFHPCLVNQVADERRISMLERIVGEVVQPGGVTDVRLPANIDCLIEGGRKGNAGVSEQRCLAICRFKHHSHSTFHRGIVPYSGRFITGYLEELSRSAHGQFPCRLKATGELPGFLWSDSTPRNAHSGERSCIPGGPQQCHCSTHESYFKLMSMLARTTGLMQRWLRS